MKNEDWLKGKFNLQIRNISDKLSELEILIQYIIGRYELAKNSLKHAAETNASKLNMIGKNKWTTECILKCNGREEWK